MNIWISGFPIIEDEYELKREPGNKKDRNAVAIVRPGTRGRSCEENQVPGNEYDIYRNLWRYG